MVQHIFERVPDESAITPTTVGQFASWALGDKEFGGIINPRIQDDAKYHTFQNLGAGGNMAFLDRNGVPLLFIPSDPAGPVPTMAASTTRLYGPSGSPLLTRNSTDTVLNKTININDGNHINAGVLDSGTLDAARVPGLDASKIVSGTFAAARIPSINIGDFQTNTRDGISKSSTGSEELVACSALTVASGAIVVVFFSGYFWTNSGEPDTLLDFELRRNGSTIGANPIQRLSLFASDRRVASFHFIHVPGSGSSTYSVRWSMTTAAAVNSGNNIRLTAVELVLP